MAHAIAVSPDGLQVFVTGESRTLDVGREAVTIAYDSRLHGEQWVARYNTSDSDSGIPDGRDDVARVIGVSGDGRTVLIGGDSWGANSLDWIFAAYDTATGERQWSGLYDGILSHADFHRALAVSEDGSHVFLTGHSCGCGNEEFDIVTMGIRVDGVATADEATAWFNPRKIGRRTHAGVRRR
jgi:hypothetical protein